MHDVHEHRPLEGLCVEGQFEDRVVIHRLGTSAEIGDHGFMYAFLMKVTQVDDGMFWVKAQLIVVSSTGQNFRELLQDLDYLRVSMTGSEEVDESWGQ